MEKETVPYIRAYYGCYDPLSYPLFFPRGETGWNRWMKYICAPDGTTKDSADNNVRRGNQASEFQAGIMFITDLYSYPLIIKNLGSQPSSR